MQSYSTETILFDLVKFLLQAIFSAMEEEHEVITDNNRLSSLVTLTTNGDNDRNNDGGQNDGTTNTSGTYRELKEFH